MRSILLVKTSSLGDVVHNLPVASDIRARFPEACIDWVVEEGFADIPRLHPAVRKVSFTGSVATGKKVAAACAPDLKRMTLELGGNDAAIVLDDVDPQQVAEKLFWGAFANSGQICGAIKRLYVPERLEQPLVTALAKIAQGVKVGDQVEITYTQALAISVAAPGK